MHSLRFSLKGTFRMVYESVHDDKRQFSLLLAFLWFQASSSKFGIEKNLEKWLCAPRYKCVADKQWTIVMGVAAACVALVDTKCDKNFCVA